MKRIHLTLYGQILFWAFLNLALVGGVLFLVLHVQFKVSLWSLLSGQVNARIEATGELMAAELREVHRSEWDGILTRYDEVYGVTFSVFRPDGDGLLGGAEQELPEALREVLRAEFPRPAEREGPPGGRRPPPGEGPRGEGPPREGPPGEGRRPGLPGGGEDSVGPDRRGRPGPGAPPRVVFYEHDPEGGRYWAALRIPLQGEGFRHPPDGVLVASADRLGGNDLFFDWRPWAWTLLGILLVSALIWFPFVRRVSRRLRKLTAAAESISEGDFEVEVASGRTDELGRLSRAVQRMAVRLDDYVSGQKRFLGDIAHELCSPLVRARMSLGILEQEVPDQDRDKLASVQEEVEELSHLVNELLDFSKASLKPRELPRESLALTELLDEVVLREAPGRKIVQMVEDDLQLSSNRDLLKRAVGNVVRNAVRYSDEGGEIVVRAVGKQGQVIIQVLDRGPGVPDEWVHRIFEPFSRPERARTRESGGSGLGLAIARTCTEALGGTVRGRNREGGGFAVEFLFPPNP